jgi:hypothetical protein
MDIKLFDQVPHQKFRITHFDPTGFGLLAPGNNATVIVAQYNHGFTIKLRTEKPFS